MVQLTEIQKMILTKVYETNGLPEFRAKDFVIEHQKEIDGMVEAGLLKPVMVRPRAYDHDIQVYAATNRGFAHLVVNCGIAFSGLCKMWPSATAKIQREAQLKRGSLASDAELEILYYHTFKKYIEWEYFDERHDFLLPHDMIEAAKLGLQILSAVCEDQRISEKSIIKLTGLPEQAVKMLGGDRKSLKAAIDAQLAMY
jgi:hypothetical protein